MFYYYWGYGIVLDLDFILIKIFNIQKGFQSSCLLKHLCQNLTENNAQRTWQNYINLLWFNRY